LVTTATILSDFTGAAAATPAAFEAEDANDSAAAAAAFPAG
jgi:hypothetical protein